MNGNLLLLLKSSIVLVYDAILQRFSKSSGLTSVADSRLARILTFSTGCSSDTNHGIDTIAWSNSEGVFSSSDGGHSFAKVSWPFSQSMLIVEVVFHFFYHSFFFLVHDSSDAKNQFTVLEYIDRASPWRQHALNLTKFTGEAQSFTFLPKSSHFVLVWSSKAIFHGALNGEGALLDLRTRDGIRPFIVDATANISTICTGWSEEFVVLLNDGRMFYGRSHLSYIVEVFPGEPDTSQISTTFDLTGQLILITNSSDGLNRRIFPLQNEVTSAMFPDIQCPYLELSSNIPPDVQYIDKGETKSFWVSLLHHLSSSNTVVHKLSSTSLVKVTMDEHSQYYPGMVMINKTFTFTKTKIDYNYTQNSTFGKGTISVLFHPKMAGLTCKDHCEKALLIKTDCPPTRHLRIRNCTAKAMPEVPSMDFTNYHNMVQCELTSRVGSQMTLVLDMYDDNQWVMMITQNYILWEENNKKGFSYTATMAQAGCVKEAQNWAKMSTEETNNSSWHQNNYESCFEGDGTKFDGSKSYEILNSTGVSRVIFTEGGRFTFTLKVIDPSVSFCTLTVRFTVMVSPGEHSKEFLPEIIAMCTVILISLGLLCASFWFYRRETLGEHEQDRQAAERLQQLRSIYKGVRMSVDETAAAAGGVRHSIRRSSGAAALLMGLDHKKSSQAGTSLDTFIEEEDDED